MERASCSRDHQSAAFSSEARRSFILRPQSIAESSPCPESLEDGQQWSFYLINDSDEPLHETKLRDAAYEWGDFVRFVDYLQKWATSCPNDVTAAERCNGSALSALGLSAPKQAHGVRRQPIPNHGWRQFRKGNPRNPSRC
jgi:hypothetical protein